MGTFVLWISQVCCNKYLDNNSCHLAGRVLHRLGKRLLQCTCERCIAVGVAGQAACGEVR